MARGRQSSEDVLIIWGEFARDLKLLREFTRKSQNDIASLCNIGHATVCRAENGRAVSAAAFIALCDFMNCDPRRYVSAPLGASQPTPPPEDGR